MKSIKDKIRRKFNVSIAEFGDLDTATAASLGVVMAGNDTKYILGALEKLKATLDDWPEAQLYRGHKKVRGFLEQWLGMWDTYEAGYKELIDAGDRVVALGWQRGRIRGSEAEVEMQYAEVCTLREGQIVRVEIYSDPAKALEDAGLPESEKAKALAAVGLQE